jgi:hypothetical protein
MSHSDLCLALLLGFASACGSGTGRPPREAAASSQTDDARGCRILTAADIREIAGASVHLIDRGASPGAGGTCGNYATDENDAYLGVNALESASEYAAAVAAVPVDVYPRREAIPGLGDEAVLMKDDTGMLRYLVARKSNRGVVLFPLGRAAQAMSDTQLRQLAERALAAR